MHPEQEERFHVREGQMKFRLGLRRIVAGPGEKPPAADVIGFTVAVAVAVATAVVVWRYLPRERKPVGAELPPRRQRRRCRSGTGGPAPPAIEVGGRRS
ncbi:MAG TPA: hypothetical protein VHJ39_10960 [Solirubrobacteraceae bacterium]|nr:hypothetical protein [Solirubrobacteraceae bacterium]